MNRADATPQSARDPALILSHQRAAAYARWSAAQQEAERIEWSVPRELRRTCDGLRRLEAAGYVAARVRENRLWFAAERIELRLAETVPTSVLGILALARCAAANHLQFDGRDRCMLDRVMEAIDALPSSPALEKARAASWAAREEYNEVDEAKARGVWPLPSGDGMLALISALRTLAARVVA